LFLMIQQFIANLFVKKTEIRVGYRISINKTNPKQVQKRAAPLGGVCVLLRFFIFFL